MKAGKNFNDQMVDVRNELLSALEKFNNGEISLNELHEANKKADIKMKAAKTAFRKMKNQQR